MDSSHVTWFNSLFDDFKSAVARGEFVGHEARESFLCVQLIETAYASARDGSRELPLPGLAALEGDDVSDRLARQPRAAGALGRAAARNDVTGATADSSTGRKS
jgi:hypothetical protein